MQEATVVLMKKEPMALSNCRLDKMEEVFIGQDGPTSEAVII